MERNWGTEITDPLQGRKDKPRNVGLTMVLDKGLGLNYLNDLLEMSGDYIDYIKFSFGTSFVYSREIVKKKNMKNISKEIILLLRYVFIIVTILIINWYIYF